MGGRETEGLYSYVDYWLKRRNIRKCLTISSSHSSGLNHEGKSEEIKKSVVKKKKKVRNN